MMYWMNIYKLALEQPQVAKIMYDKLEEKIYGLSVTHHDTDGTKNRERFPLEESWTQKQYSEKIVEVIRQKAENIIVVCGYKFQLVMSLTKEHFKQ